jgi:conjugal transfer mating pair stabilization protein TraG
MEVDIFTYGNGVMLTALFQAITALTATDDYLELIRVVFMISTLVVTIEIIWTGRFKATARLLTIILLLNGAILSTADVQLTDRVNAANDALIADVPAGLAVPLAVTTAIGDWATGAFETIFAMPNDLRYRSNGLLFASRLVEASTQFEITDARMANNLAEFAQGCIYYGIMAEWFTLNTIMESGNIWAALPAASFGNAIFVNYEDINGNVGMDGCKNVRTLIETDWDDAIDEMNSVYGQRLFPEYAEADAKARLLSSIPQSYAFMANIASNAADIVRQNAMVNTMRRSFTNLANNAGAPGAAQDYALAQAEAQQRTTYATLGAMAGRMMSLFSNVLETLIYGIFPIAFIFILIALMQGKAVLMYLKLLLWLQLWPPMFAILNFAMSTYAADATTAAAMQAGGGASILNMLTYTGMRAVNSDMSAMAGYLSWMIPMFSWAIVSGSGFAASQMAASLGAVAQSSGSAAAGAVSSGNISLGNYSAYNGRMFQENSSPSMNRGVGSYVDSNTGTTFTTSAGGLQTMNTQQNSTPIMANLASSLKSSVGTSMNNAVSAARTSTSGFMSSAGSAYQAMTNLRQSSGSGSNTSNGWDQNKSAQFGQDYSSMTQAAKKFAKDNNLSTNEAVGILAAAGLSTSAGFSALGNGITLGGKGQLDYSGKTLSGETWKAAHDYAKTSGFSEKYSAATKSAESLSASNTQSSNQSVADDVSSSTSNQKTASDQMQASLSNTSTWQSLSSRLSDQGASGNAAAVGAFIQYAKGQGYSLGSLDAKMAAMSSTSGDAAGATREMNNLVSGFVQGQAGEMAGVGAVPSIHDSGVRQFDQGNRQEVADASTAIGTQAQSNDSTVASAANYAGVPSTGDVARTVAATRATVETSSNGATGAIADGKESIESGSTPMVNTVIFNTDPQNQDLMAQTLTNSGDKSVDMVGDAKNTAVNLFNGGSMPSRSGDEGKVVGPGNEAHLDLPPPAPND